MAISRIIPNLLELTAVAIQVRQAYPLQEHLVVRPTLQEQVLIRTIVPEQIQDLLLEIMRIQEVTIGDLALQDQVIEVIYKAPEIHHLDFLAQVKILDLQVEELLAHAIITQEAIVQVR